jgi:hypothetical protein
MRAIGNGTIRGASLQAVLLVLTLVLLTDRSVEPLRAQLVEAVATGSTSNSFRKRAASKIPYQQMSPAVARRVAEVVNNASLYRQLPVTTIQSDPDMYLFLLRYPETIIGTWRLMGISEMTARRVAPFRLQAADGAGTTTDAELVYGQPNLNIYYAEGQYEGPMIFRKITGSCVIMVESNYQLGADGLPRVTSCMNFFLKIDNLAASIIARTVHPLVGTTADHNFVETLKFAEKLSETSGRNGPGVQRMAARLEGLTPDVRRQFQEMAGLVWQRTQAGPGTPAAMQTGFTEPVRQVVPRPRTAVDQPRHYFTQGYHLGDSPGTPPISRHYSGR